jgi:protoporphyrinogen oxidase
MKGTLDQTDAVIMGAGPAGLMAAHELIKYGFRSTVLEADDTVGGLSKTVNYKGYLFDIGGHRFYTKLRLISDAWKTFLGSDFLVRHRISRIRYRSKFLKYPLEPLDLLRNLGPVEVARCALSYLHAQLNPIRPETDFRAWVSNRFGRRLFDVFFRTYTEKVWGIRCEQISADWAEQRIRGLSIGAILRDFFRGLGVSSAEVKTLIHEFEYPRRGPGMMWQRVRDLLEQQGSHVVTNSRVEKVFWRDNQVTGLLSGNRTYHAPHYISSIAIRDLFEALDPAPPEEVRRAAESLRYRDFLTVALILDCPDLFPDNWIYVHDPGVKVGRIQNYTNWSPDMVPDARTSCLGLEYFCFENDGLWNMSDESLIALATKELRTIGLSHNARVLDGKVVRVQKAYPVYDAAYKNALAVIREFTDGISNLQLIGRNGMHRYNNQDHSMLMGILAARNIAGAQYDLWEIGSDGGYLEEGGDITDEELRDFIASQPAVPDRR